MLIYKQMTFLTGLTATLQLHVVPLGGSYLAVCLLAGCLTLGALRYVGRFLHYAWYWLLGLLFLFQGVSLFWAYSHRIGARTLIYQVPFLLLPLAMAQLTINRRESAIRLMKIVLGFTVLQALAVITFRVLPGVKSAYIHSIFANLFESANRLADYANADPSLSALGGGKSAGLTTYPNPAAAWLGLAAVTSWYFARFCNSTALRIVAVVDFLAVFFTGSKAGVITAAVILCLMGAIELAERLGRHRRVDMRLLIIGCFSASLMVCLLPFATEILEHFTSESSSTLSTRQELWSFAVYEFHRHAMFGLGFGKWEAIVPIQGRTPHMPPHNAFIMLWAQSGLIAVFVGACFVLAFLGWALERSINGTEEEHFIAKGLFAGYLWMVLQAQGENFGIFGEDHMKPIVALMAGLLVGLCPHWRAAPHPSGVRA